MTHDIPNDTVPHSGASPIHGWFGLSYANYLVLNRTLMQSMPMGWQRDMARLLAELDECCQGMDRPDSYMVKPKDFGGRFVRETIPHYRRGPIDLPGLAGLEL